MPRAWDGNKATRWSVAAPSRPAAVAFPSRPTVAATPPGRRSSRSTGIWYRLWGGSKPGRCRGRRRPAEHPKHAGGPDACGAGDAGTGRTSRRCSKPRSPGLKWNYLGSWGSSTGQACYDDVVLEPVAETEHESKHIRFSFTALLPVPLAGLHAGQHLARNSSLFENSASRVSNQAGYKQVMKTKHHPVVPTIIAFAAAAQSASPGKILAAFKDFVSNGVLVVKARAGRRVPPRKGDKLSFEIPESWKGRSIPAISPKSAWRGITRHGRASAGMNVVAGQEIVFYFSRHNQPVEVELHPARHCFSDQQGQDRLCDLRQPRRVAGNVRG